MAILHTTTGQPENRPYTSSLFLNHTSRAAALKRTGIKIAGISLLLVIGTLLVLATRAGGNQASPAGNSLTSSAEKTDQTSPQQPTGSKPDTRSSSVSQQTQTSQQLPSSDGHNSASMQVTVNGENIPVPQNGSVQRTIETPSGTTNLNVSTSTDGSSINSSLTSTNMNVSSSSWSISSDGTNTYVNGTTSP